MLASPLVSSSSATIQSRALSSIALDAELAIDELTFEDDPVDAVLQILNRIRSNAMEAMK